MRRHHEEAVYENGDRKMQEADTTVIPSLNVVSPLTEKEAKLIGEFLWSFIYLGFCTKITITSLNALLRTAYSNTY